MTLLSIFSFYYQPFIPCKWKKEFSIRNNIFLEGFLLILILYNDYFYRGFPQKSRNLALHRNATKKTLASQTMHKAMIWIILWGQEREAVRRHPPSPATIHHHLAHQVTSIKDIAFHIANLTTFICRPIHCNLWWRLTAPELISKTKKDHL